MPSSNIPLRVNLQRVYRWSRFRHDYCQLCKGPLGYGALVEVYTPPPQEKDPSLTEAEAFQAADDYCNVLAESQETGHFTMYAMYPICGACASREIIEDLTDFAAPFLETVRAQQHEHLWVAVCLQYEPGAYGRYQPFFIYSYLPLSIEKIYAQARSTYLSDEPRFELVRFPHKKRHNSPRGENRPD